MRNSYLLALFALVFVSVGCQPNEPDSVNNASALTVPMDISKYIDKKAKAVDLKKLDLAIQGSGWGEMTDRTATYQIYVSLRNNHSKPIHEVWLTGAITFSSLPGKKVPLNIRMVPLVGPMGYTQELLLPGHTSEVFVAKAELTQEEWRRDIQFDIRVKSAQEYLPTAGSTLVNDVVTLTNILPTSVALSYLKSISHKFCKGVGDIDLLDYALFQGNLELAKGLQAMDYDIKHKNTYGFNALHFAVFGGPKAVEYCISQGVTPIAIDNPFNRPGDGRTLLHIAVRADRTDVIPAIVKAGVNINQANKQGLTPLHFAIMTRNLAAAKLLISLGASKAVFDSTGRGPLGVALESGTFDYVDAVAKLLGGYSEKSPDGLTPLHHAARLSKFDLAAFLMHKGLSPQAKDQFGSTPISLAQAISHPGDRAIMLEVLRTGQYFRR